MSTPSAQATAFAEGVFRALDEGNGRQFELWEPERLRRQVAIFEAAVAAEIEANFEAREEIADLGRRLAAVNSALDDARGTVVAARNEAAATSAAARRAEQEAAELRAELDDITHSRAWGSCRDTEGSDRPSPVVTTGLERERGRDRRGRPRRGRSRVATGFHHRLLLRRHRDHLPVHRSHPEEHRWRELRADPGRRRVRRSGCPTTRWGAPGPVGPVGPQPRLHRRGQPGCPPCGG